MEGTCVHPEHMRLRSLILRGVAATRIFRRVAQPCLLAAVLLVDVFWATTAPAEEMRALRPHVPKTAIQSEVGRLSPTNSLRLAISLPLRNNDALNALLQRLYDPHSPDYRLFLTPAQFNERFGPTPQDYQAVVDFARTNGLEIVERHESRMLLDVRGKVPDLERTFHVTMKTYRHPTEPRLFHAPDVAPTIRADLPILDVTGLDDFAVAHNMLRHKPKGAVPVSASNNGSGPGGVYSGD